MVARHVSVPPLAGGAPVYLGPPGANDSGRTAPLCPRNVDDGTPGINGNNPAYRRIENSAASDQGQSDAPIRKMEFFK